MILRGCFIIQHANYVMTERNTKRLFILLLSVQVKLRVSEFRKSSNYVIVGVEFIMCKLGYLNLIALCYKSFRSSVETASQYLVSGRKEHKFHNFALCFQEKQPYLSPFK